MENKQKDIYDKKYLDVYREKVSGFEYARWKALSHFILKVLKFRKTDKKAILDYGCGSGMHVDLWRGLFPSSDLYFCDISPVALEKLKNKYPEFGSRCIETKENIAALDSNSFDIIVSIEVMEHVKDLNEYLKDIYRLLKSEGVFIWTTPCANWFSIEHIYSLLTKKIENTTEGYVKWKWEDTTHVQRLKSIEIKKKLQETGFNDVGFRYRSHFFSFVCTNLFKGQLKKLGERMMLLDYSLFRKFPNGASMIGYAKK